jgi:hypothetical protein
MRKSHQQRECQQQVTFPGALEKLAEGRDFISTPEFAQTFSIAHQTVRKNLCMAGQCYGIRPVKFGNRLLWPVAEVAVLLCGGQK